jgi:Na+-driven multidrug efflux pump
VAIAAQALVGRFLGAGDGDGARRIGRRMLGWGIGTGVVAGVALAVFHRLLPGLFSRDAEVVAATASLVLVAAGLQPLNGAVFVLDGLLIGAGDMRYLAGAMVVGLVVFAGAAGTVAATGAGVVWLWGALGLLMVTRLVTLGLRWRGSRWVVTGAER